MKQISVPLLALALWIPALAGTAPSCAVVEDNNASSELRVHAPTAQVLERLNTDRTFTVSAAATQLKAVQGEGLDNVIGHLRMTATVGTGEKRAQAYEVLFAMSVGGRADVADQFTAGLNDSEERARLASARGLRLAPSGKKAKVGRALLDRLAESDTPSVHQATLGSLALVATPALQDRASEIEAVLKQDPPADVVPDRQVELRSKAATAVIRVRGFDDATAVFRTLDPDTSGERYGIEGALRALSDFALAHLPDDDPERDGQLRSGLRDFGVGVLAHTNEKAEQTTRVRRTVVQFLFPAVAREYLSEWRSEDAVAIRSALVEALPYEGEGSEVGKLITRFLARLPQQDEEASTHG